MGRWPWIVWGGAGILGWVAGEMIFRESFVAARIPEHAVRVGVSAALAVTLFGVAWWTARRHAGEPQAAHTP
jgi:predicted tellurium resistance membrane protein TerC